MGLVPASECAWRAVPKQVSNRSQRMSPPPRNSASPWTPDIVCAMHRTNSYHCHNRLVQHNQHIHRSLRSHLRLRSPGRCRVDRRTAPSGNQTTALHRPLLRPPRSQRSATHHPFLSFQAWSKADNAHHRAARKPSQSRLCTNIIFQISHGARVPMAGNAGFATTGYC